MSTEMQASIERVCSLPPGCEAQAITSDGHVIAFSVEDNGRLRFVWDGNLGQPFDGLGERRDKTAAIYTSEDGAHLAYIGIRGDKVFVGRDDGEDPPFEGSSRSVPPTFDGGGRHLAYGAMVADGEYRLVVDGQVVGTSQLASIALAFSPDGNRLAYAEMRGEKRDSIEYRIVLDSQPGDWFRGMRNAANAMQFSPDGQRFAYYTIDGEGHARWFVDGAAQRSFNDTRSISLALFRGISVLDPPLPAAFSPDSRRFAYFADVVEKGVAVLEDDTPGPLFKGVGRPTFSHDSHHLAYAAETFNKTTTLVLDGMMTGEWPASGGGIPVFSSNSRRVAITLGREEGGFLRKRHLTSVVVDGLRSPELPGHDAAFWPTFSPDGERVAWWLQETKGADGILVIDGNVQRDSPLVLGDIHYSSSGLLVYPGRIGASHTVVIDGRPGPLANAIATLRPATDAFGGDTSRPGAVAFRLSADGNHVVWAGRFDAGTCPVFDDEVGPPFDDIIDCGVNEAGAAVWWAQTGEDVFRVERSTPTNSPMASSGVSVA